MSCKNCGSPFHEIWDCKKPLTPRVAAYRDNSRVPNEASAALPVHETAKSTVSKPSPMKPKDTRKTDRHKPGYQAAKQREYRANRRAKIKAGK